MKRIRAGLYEYRDYTIEHANRAAEYHPGNLDYNQWLVTNPGKFDDRWLSTFPTLKSAKNAIDDELHGYNQPTAGEIKKFILEETGVNVQTIKIAKVIHLKANQELIKGWPLWQVSHFVISQVLL